MAKKFAKTVTLPDFDEKAAYNHDRPISSLIRTQLLHLHMAEHLKLSEKDRTNVNINHLHTERQASQYIQAVTSKLHAAGAREKRPAKRKKPKTGKKAAKKSARASGKMAPKRRSDAKKRK